MPTRNNARQFKLTFYNAVTGSPNELTVTESQNYSTWQVSPRDPSGTLLLRSNPCDMQRAQSLRYVHVGRPTKYGPEKVASLAGATWRTGTAHPFGGTGKYKPTALTNRAYSRFWGRVRMDKASLGVSLAGYGQSRDMMKNRAKQFAKLLLDQIRSFKASHRRLKRAIRALERNRKKNPAYEDRANDFLEAKFGWAPLIEDFVAASRLFWTPPPARYFRGSATEVTSVTMPRSVSILPEQFHAERWGITVSCTYGAKVKVTNDELWLANKAGLINLPSIAWDLVPWSWVVNMFVNVNQMLQHHFNEVGISLTDTSVTFTHREIRETEVRNLYSSGYVIDNALYYRKVRTLSNLKPSWAVRAPELDASLVVTATALVLQRARKLRALFP